MKRIIFKYILRARFTCEGKHFWRFESARSHAIAQQLASAVYSINGKRLFHKHSDLWALDGVISPHGEGW